MKKYLFILLFCVFGFMVYQACTTQSPAPQPTQKRKANTDTVYVAPPTGGGGGGTPPTGLQPPNDLNIAISKSYAINNENYNDLLNEVQGGESKFWFYGKSNGNPYPTADWVNSANGYTTITFPTHSVNTRNNLGGYPAYDNVICKVEFTIKDSEGNIVMYCKDTKGGFHPSFRPQKRGNNHPLQAQRYLPFGSYTVEFKNISDDPNVQIPIHFTLGRPGTSITEFIDVHVNKNETITRTFQLFDSPQNQMFKMNCDLY